MKNRFALVALPTIVFLTGVANADQLLLDERWADASRAETKRPAEAAVWVGRDSDVTVSKGVLSTKLGDTSQKIWTYFTDGEPVTLSPGQTLTASVSFVPRKALAQATSRSLRIGLFHDPTSPRVETDVNSDSGGSDAPWTDAKGYGVHVLVTGGPSSTKPFDLGKRVNLSSQSLIGTSGDYFKMTGGAPAALELDKEYRVTLSIERVSETVVKLTASLYQGSEQLSTWSMSDDGSTLGGAPTYDKFDQLFIRIANNTTTADQIDFTNFKVELSSAAGE